MSAMEDSLRRALEAGDAGDPAFRQTIYDAAQRALERMIHARALDEPSADGQRNRLVETIMRVEGEYFDYYNAGDGEASDEAEYADAEYAEAGADGDGDGRADTHPPRAGPGPVDAAAGGGRGPPGIEPAADARRPASFEPEAATFAEPDDAASGGEASAARRSELSRRNSRKFLIGLLAALAVVVLLVVYVLFTVFSSAVGEAGGPASPSETPVPEPTTSLAPGEDPVWISVFTGNDLEALSTPNGGRIETVSGAGDRPAVRVSAPEGGDGEVILSVGPGLVGELSGSRIRVELTAGSPDDTPREFSVRCVFGTASVCERQRFQTILREEAFVFDIEIPADAQSPAGLAIGPGLGNSGSDLDIYAVRMRVLG